MNFHNPGKQPIPRFIITFLLVFIGLPLVLAFSLDRQEEVPVNPTTIPEYDTVAGVVMYWDLDFNDAYNQIVSLVVNGIQPRATVFMQTNNQEHRDHMISTFAHYGVHIDNIVFIDVYGDRIWIRDHGPFSIYDNDSLAFVGFNDLAVNHGDQDLPQRLAEYWGINYYDFPHIIFDGGNYLVDSHGRLFATDRLYTNNQGIPAETIDTILETYMAIDTIITFEALSDDYWGHLDMQVKLLNDTTFVISSVDEWHPDHQILQGNLAILQSLEHPEGKSYQIEQIPKADNWKTYINSLIVNDAVLVPIYSSQSDSYALQTYQDLMPGAEVIGIDCNAMIHWEGAIHCITNQIPPVHAPTGDDDNGDDDNGDDDNGDDDNGDDDNGDDDNGDDDNGDDDNGDDDNGDDDNGDDDNGDDGNGDDDNGDDDNGDDGNGDDDGDETQMRELETGIADNTITIYPNPATDLTFVDFRITGRDDYRLEVLDANGRQVHWVNIPAWYLGDYSVPVDIQALDPGVYIIRLSGSKGSVSDRLMVP